MFWGRRNRFVRTKNNTTSQASRWFLHSSNSLWPWQISWSDSNDCNWTGTVPSHSALSITLDAICCFHSFVRACICICVCPCVSQCVPVRSPLAAGRCAGNRERQYESVGVLVCLWNYEKLPACSAAWVHCEATARKRCGGSGACSGHRSSPPTTLHLMTGGEKVKPHGIQGMKV